MDPLLRNIHRYPVIRCVEVKTMITISKVNCKARGFAYDVNAICKLIEGVFREI
jgi:hypothetical protein